jgi:valyl-tRNA synthetase
MIEKYGADALRFTLLSGLHSGKDSKFAEQKIEGYRNFMNKVWNATRFGLSHLQDLVVPPEGVHALPKKVDLSVYDQWILYKLQLTTQKVDESLAADRYADAAMALYHFVWNEFCDWYIEMSKQGKNSQVLKTVLTGVLQMLHPIAPFITEELWHLLGHSDMIMVSAFPKADKKLIDPLIEKEFKLVIDLVNSIRSVRSEMNVPLGKEIDVVLLKTDAVSQKIIKANESFITKLAKLKKIEISNQKPEPAVLKVVEGIEVYLPMAGLVDIESEQKRLQKEIENLLKEVARFESKLSNAAFVDKAPPAVIEGERAKQKTAQEKLSTIQKQLDSLSALA